MLEAKLYDFISKLDVYVCAHPIHIYIHTYACTHTLFRLYDIAVSARDQVNSIAGTGSQSRKLHSIWAMNSSNKYSAKL